MTFSNKVQRPWDHPSHGRISEMLGLHLNLLLSLSLFSFSSPASPKQNKTQQQQSFAFARAPRSSLGYKFLLESLPCRCGESCICWYTYTKFQCFGCKPAWSWVCFYCCCIWLGFSSGKGSFLSISANSHGSLSDAKIEMETRSRGAAGQKGHIRRT